MADSTLTKLEAHLLNQNSPTYSAYYNGKMSYKLHGREWEKYVEDTFPDLANQTTSENLFKTAIDMYVENLVPLPEELRGFRDTIVPLLARGQAPVVVAPDGTVAFPEHYEILTDGNFTIAAVFTRSLEHMKDYVTFAYSNGVTRLFEKTVPDDLSPATRTGYNFVEENNGNNLLLFTLDDRGFGAALAALQDRANHSILDQTVIAEMYARPFWYLLNVELPPENPYLPTPSGGGAAMKEHKTKGASGRVFTTSSEGPFGQLTPPTINDMVAYHNSIIDKVSQTTGIPQHYFKPGEGTPPTGIALKVLSRRYSNKVARIRDSIQPQLEALAELLNIQPLEGDTEVQFWPESDDLLQDALDAHGLALAQMGYPIEYIAEVVTPGVNLDDYLNDGFNESRAQVNFPLIDPEEVEVNTPEDNEPAG